MNTNQSQMHAVEARIRQIQESELFTDSEREHRLAEAKAELLSLTNQINQIEVNNPEILS